MGDRDQQGGSLSNSAAIAGRKAKLKLATEAGLAVTGGKLAYIANRMGAPDVAAIAATSGSKQTAPGVTWLSTTTASSAPTCRRDR